MAGRTGHLATFDWKTGTLHAELQVQETCRDITYVAFETSTKEKLMSVYLDFCKITPSLPSLKKNMFLFMTTME